MGDVTVSGGDGGAAFVHEGVDPDSLYDVVIIVRRPEDRQLSVPYDTIGGVVGSFDVLSANQIRHAGGIAQKVVTDALERLASGEATLPSKGMFERGARENEGSKDRETE